MSEISWAELIQGSADALKPVPDGDYPFIVDDATSKQASTGAPMIVAKLKIRDGAHAGRKISQNFVLSVESQMALAIFFRNMANMGLDANYWAQLPPGMPGLELAAKALIGRTGRMTLSHRTWQGVDRNEVKNILPDLPGVGPVAPGTVTGPPIPVPSRMPTPSATAAPTPTPPVPTSAPTPSSTPSTPQTPGSPSGPPPLPF